MHTRTRTHAHTHQRSCTHAHRPRARVQGRAHAHAVTHEHAHARTQGMGTPSTHVFTHVLTHMRTHAQTCMPADEPACVALILRPALRFVSSSGTPFRRAQADESLPVYLNWVGLVWHRFPLAAPALPAPSRSCSKLPTTESGRSSKSLRANRCEIGGGGSSLQLHLHFVLVEH
eukprot:454334-Pleurochrysis_carterae.AAC.1